MKIAMVASESNPFCKTGGLADVVFALSRELVALGNEVCVILPYYSTMNKIPSIKIERLFNYEVDMSWRRQEATIYKAFYEGVSFYFIGNDYYFMRGSLYGFHDDGERFAFFTMAVESLFASISFSPDVVHIHDWQPGMLPLLLKARHRNDPLFSHTKTVLTIHNPEFKGMVDPYFLGDFYDLPYSYYEDGTTKYSDMVSTLKTAVMTVDKVTTVSPTHRQELLTSLYSRGMDGPLKLRENDFVGIVNGIDEEEWDPEKDIDISANFGAKTLTSGKAKCRKSLIETAGLIDNGGPCFGLVSRLTSQKGIHLVAKVGRELLNRGALLFLVGSGEEALERSLQSLQCEYPESCSVYFGYNNALAHKVYAGCDFFLMPSLFEPCGIGQMIAERYATLPVARDTGGLHDTIVSYPEFPSEATGFLFRDFDEGGLFYACSKALEVFGDKKKLRNMRLNAMKMDHGWKKSAESYLALYKSA
jgi:starch synthase